MSHRLLVVGVAAALSAARADAQSPADPIRPPVSQAVSINPLYIPFGGFVVEYEAATARGVTLGLSGGYYDPVGDDAAPNTRALKDPTRGGVASSLNEIAQHANVGIAVDEERVPVRADVRGACEILGLDPLHIANEGKLIAVVPPAEADAALAAMRSHPLGRDAAVIGEVRAEPAAMVVLRTGVGGSRVLDMLVGDPLPRIC